MLRDYQKRAVEFHLLKKSSYSAVDMGLGKTLIALEWAERVLLLDKTVTSILVIAPLYPALETWPAEIKKWKPHLDFTVLHGKQKGDNLSKDCPIKIINFEGLKWLLSAAGENYYKAKKLPFQAVIVDEASKVKNHSTGRFKILKVLFSLLTPWRLLMSGTPAPNSMLDLWSQFYLLDEGHRLEKNITRYRSKYFFQDGSRFNWVLRPETDKKIIYDKIADITFRLDSVDYLELPPITYNAIKLDLDKPLKAMYKKLETEFFLSLENGEEVEAPNSLSLSMKLRQFLQGAIYGVTKEDEKTLVDIHRGKIIALKDFLDSTDANVLCAIQFKFELDLILEEFPGTPFITGKTPQGTAKEHFKNWNEGRIPLLVCHPNSVSHGLNIQHGSNVILWLGLTWSYETYAQFNARLHRSGQIKPVFVNHILYKSTIDMDVYRALVDKESQQKSLLDHLKEKRSSGNVSQDNFSG